MPRSHDHLQAVAEAADAWAAWESACADRRRVIDLDSALTPVADTIGLSVSRLRHEIAARIGDGFNVTGALWDILEPRNLFDDTDQPLSVGVPVGEYL